MKTKTKLTIAVASVLSVATLAGTGYAGWVLSHNVSEKKDGSMQAYGVADKTVKLEIKDFDEPKAIVWGKTIKDSTLQHSWFGFTAVNDEAFNPALNFTVTNTETDDHTEPVIESARITVIDSDNAYKTCLDNHLITGATDMGSKEGEFVADIKQGLALQGQAGTSNVFTYKLNLQAVEGKNLFGWGTAFGNKNPLNYYNQFSAEDLVEETSTKTNTTYFADAKKKMERIEKLNNLSFRIDLTVNHASL